MGRMIWSDTDTARMHQALALAQQALFITSPNPRVGCVMTSPNGEVLGEGHTQAAGLAHAEIMALRDAQARGHSVQGATAYVTLEPCAHHGRTGPCCDALIDARYRQGRGQRARPQSTGSRFGVCAIARSGYPSRCGSGRARGHRTEHRFFQTHDARYTVAAHEVSAIAGWPNRFAQWAKPMDHRRGGSLGWSPLARPCLRHPEWHRHSAARQPPVERARREHPSSAASAVGRFTFANPLDARLWETTRQVVIYHAERDTTKEEALKAQGAELVHLPDTGHKVDLNAMLQDMGQRAYNEVHIEAGHKLNGSLLNAGLVDELLIYISPVLLGAGQHMAALPALAQLGDAAKWSYTSHSAVGPDLRLLGQTASLICQNSAYVHRHHHRRGAHRRRARPGSFFGSWQTP
jgi:diaminohydroxyphosphoribosylaminopyrimidine deaminase / 5-amino-6-(5-phosphoribosylamino)uracil reductase